MITEQLVFVPDSDFSLLLNTKCLIGSWEIFLFALTCQYLHAVPQGRVSGRRWKRPVFVDLIQKRLHTVVASFSDVYTR